MMMMMVMKNRVVVELQVHLGLLSKAQVKVKTGRRIENLEQKELMIKNSTEFDPVTKRPKVTLKWKPPKVMKVIPLPKLKQDFSRHFRWWYYDWRSSEAVIVLDVDGNWETIRILDPMWLTNLSEDDVYTLYKCQIFFDVRDMDQALRYMRVIRVCFAHKIHAGIS